jgi:hypothetical protein
MAGRIDGRDLLDLHFDQIFHGFIIILLHVVGMWTVHIIPIYREYLHTYIIYGILTVKVRFHYLPLYVVHTVRVLCVHTNTRLVGGS